MACIDQSLHLNKRSGFEGEQSNLEWFRLDCERNYCSDSFSYYFKNNMKIVEKLSLESLQ